MFREAVDLTEEVEYLGLVSYSTEYTYNGVSAETVTTEVEMTDNSAAIENAIISIGTEPIIGGTNISAGLDRGVEVVLDASTGRPFAFKVIILMTDGQWNAGRSPVAAAQDAANRNIVVHTITFSAGANQADMQQVADITGGKHYHAPTRTELEEAFREIAFSVPVVLIE